MSGSRCDEKNDPVSSEKEVKKKKCRASAQSPYPRFHRRFIWWALGLATLLGFATGAHLAAVRGLAFPLRRSYFPLVQVHGHLQLLAWAGLFIMAISLHFLPRLASVKIRRDRATHRVLMLVVTGILLRTVGQSALPYVATGTTGWWIWGGLATAGGAMEGTAIIGYLYLLGEVAVYSGKIGKVKYRQIFPLVALMMTGWLVYGGLQVYLLVDMMAQGTYLLSLPYNQWGNTAFLLLVLFPVCMAFSLRLLPMFVHLKPKGNSVGLVTGIYALSAGVEVIGGWWYALDIPPTILHLAPVVRAGVLLYFVWHLNLFPRLTPGRLWGSRIIPRLGSSYRPGRPSEIDRFGPFHRIIYSAYLWLVLAACLEIVNSTLLLAGQGEIWSVDLVRHLYLLGFVTMLILGVGGRMIPGLMYREQIYSKRLVAAVFWLANLTVLARILPDLVGIFLPSRGMEILQMIFAGSGVLGMATIICFAVNLRKTSKMTYHLKPVDQN